MSSPDVQKMPLSSLTAMVIGSMVGAGIFNPMSHGEATRRWAASAIGAYLARRHARERRRE